MPHILINIYLFATTQLLGIDKTRGSLAPGMWCDLIATPDNLIEDIQALKKISLVMKNGIIIKK